LPNSLTRVLPFALVYSTHLPVSVCGTGAQASTLRGFSWQQGLATLGSGPRYHPSAQRTDFPMRLNAYRLRTDHVHRPAGLPHCVTPSLHSSGTGMLTGCPSPTPCGLGLGPTNPTRTALPSETLDLRRTRFSRVLRYSCRHSHFRPLQPCFRSTFHAGGTLPYRSVLRRNPWLRYRA
jgi:hypothetical protein